MKKIFQQLHSRRVWLLEIAMLVTVFVALAILLMQKFGEQRILVAEEAGLDLFLLYVGLTLSVFPVIFMLIQAILVCFYHPVTSWPEGKALPGCTVIVPAYNEGKAVAHTLRSLLKSDYPESLLEIIAIDDGSQDDTWAWIQRAAEESDGRIRTLRQTQNGGKKRALYRGFHEAKNEIVITIDSDSLVQKDTISKLILPFADPVVGGSAGAVRAGNLKEGFVPRMLDVCFVFSCNFMRCAQSVIGAVLCSPGAISSYRKAVLLPLLDKWMNQTFLGRPSTIGEDRALTSLVLRSGYHVVLQHNAKVTTNVPTDYPQLCRTLLRWTRGDVREGLLMLRHFFRHFDLRNFRLTMLQYNLLSQLLGLALPVILLPCSIALFILCRHNFLFLIYYTIAVTWVWAIIPALLYAEAESPLKAVWAFAYGLFNLVALSWICIYSWVTLNNSKWLTRDLSVYRKKEDDTPLHNDVS